MNTCFNCGKLGHFAKDCPTMVHSKTSSNGNGSSGGCFNCGKFGHFATNCPAMVKTSHTQFSNTCFNCGGVGHSKNRCPSKPASKPVVGAKSQQDVVKNNTFHHATDWIAVIDVSSSMSGSRLTSAKDALANDIEPRMKEDDRMALITFDTNAFFKLKLRPVGELRRKGELGPLLDRIFAQGNTALWDAIWLAIEQINDKSRRTVISVLTDGEDNSSKHSYAEICALLSSFPNVRLNIVHIGHISNKEYENVTTVARGKYNLVVDETLIRATLAAAFSTVTTVTTQTTTTVTVQATI